MRTSEEKKTKIAHIMTSESKISIKKTWRLGMVTKVWRQDSTKFVAIITHSSKFRQVFDYVLLMTPALVHCISYTLRLGSIYMYVQGSGYTVYL